MSKNSKKKPAKDEVEIVNNHVSGETISKDKLVKLVAMAEMYEGPLPKASEFKAYEDAVPGAGDKIIGMAERALKGEIRNRYLDGFTQLISVVLGKAFVYFLVITAVYLLTRGYEAAAIATFIAAFTPIIAQVISGTDNKKEKEPPKKKPGKKKDTKGE